ncbi:Auxin-responsive protein SAUR40 [Vitis vinifera]|uniref:Auxin-responsive protein SAUR40 n=1 Tax=Vitis vinifera TaxID=29760 RepID=A0A438E497_VITVI|nr:Auxin-responsive protein SAUR40 [Vitis vinifera]
MLRRWRLKAAEASRMSSSCIPSDVPAGHVAVCVGTDGKRFVVRATYLNHPVFKKLLVEAEEEYGFTNQGPLSLPCDESVFEEILCFISRSEASNSARFVNREDFQRYCHVGIRSSLDFWPESRPLLHSKSICLRKEKKKIRFNSIDSVEFLEMYGDGILGGEFPPSRPGFESE